LIGGHIGPCPQCYCQYIHFDTDIMDIA
jgi:hypothetical protein